MKFLLASAISAIAMTCMVIFVDYENPDWKVLMYCVLIRAGIVANFLTLFMAHPTFFPTSFTATSIGISNFIARSFVIMAPLCAEAATPIPETLAISLLILNILSVLCLKIEKHDDQKAFKN